MQKNNVVDIASINAVRYGEPADEREIHMLLMIAHAENSIFKYDLNKTAFIIRRLLFTPWLPPTDPGIRGAFGVIGPKGGVLQALAMMAISHQWYSHAPYLEEFIVYVHPEYRNRNHAARLLDWMMERSDQMGIPLLTGVLSQTRTEAKCRLYRRKLTPVGQFFMHMPPKAQWESEVILSGLTSLISSSAAA
jgi:GNAT superfamily N-acetyltransferase